MALCVQSLSSWDLLQDKFTLSANQLIEIKLASYSFKCNANLKYDQTVRRLNKPSESPIHFAFTTDYDDDSVPKCPHYTNGDSNTARPNSRSTTYLYILPVSAPPISAAASTSSTNTPTSTPTKQLNKKQLNKKQLNTRLTEINFD